MQFSDELSKLVIQNMEIIETAPSVVSEIEKALFESINERIEQKIKRKRNWSGVYDLVIENEYPDTSFRPNHWPIDDKEGTYDAWYGLYRTEKGDGLNWLSCATGVRGAELCLFFAFEYSHFKSDCNESNMNLREYKNKLSECYENAKSILESKGFFLAKDVRSHIYIFRPFCFDAETLAKEFPDFDEALKPLDEALDNLFEVHPVFDEFVVNTLKE